jgi:hypothetical protein
MSTKEWDLTPTLLRIPGSTSRLLAGYFMDWFSMYIAIIVKVNNGTEDFASLLVMVTFFFFRLKLKFIIEEVLGHMLLIFHLSGCPEGSRNCDYSCWSAQEAWNDP